MFNGLWIGDITDLCRLSVSSYLSTGHSYRLWTYENASLPGADVADASEIVPRSVMERWVALDEPHKLQTFANYFRYKLIHQYGGWWADLDSVAVKHHDFTSDYVFCGIDTPIREQLTDIIGCDGNIFNGCFKAPRASPMLEDLVNELDRKGFYEARCPAFAMWGTVAFTRAIYRFGLQKYKRRNNIFTPFPPSYAKSLKYEEPAIPTWAYSVHFYNLLSDEKWEGGLYRRLWDRYMSI